MHERFKVPDGLAFEAALMRALGQRARERRVARKLTQADVADVIGLSAEYYARVERGKAMPGIEVLHRLVRFLGGSADSFLGCAQAGEAAPRHQASPEGEAPEADPRPLRRVRRQLRAASPRARAFVEQLVAEMELVRRGRDE